MSKVDGVSLLESIYPHFLKEKILRIFRMNGFAMKWFYS